MPLTIDAAAILQARRGHEVGLSDWVTVTQEMVDRYADLTDDRQFLHVDPVAAARTPFDGTIAHGFLLIGLLARLGQDLDLGLPPVAMSVNYGFDKVRLVAPVRTGKRIRGRFTLRQAVERGPGQWLVTIGTTVDIDGGTQPALVADWLVLLVLQAAESSRALA
jgi:acyl dehydratase